MQQKIASSSIISGLAKGSCGQNTTAFVTAAERQGPRLRRGLLLSCLGLCWGCGTFVTATAINPAPRPLVPRSPESVQVLASNPPPEPYVDVALLEVEQSQGLNRQGMAYMIQRLREKAAELGCDAVYVKNTSEHEGEDPWLDPDSSQLLATCIVFTPPGAAPPTSLATAATSGIQLAPPSATR
ncbi:MAG: hypothetical protein RL685_1991 [Pseudomonadota bacterium]|jgi:hypothetical protein